MIHGSIYKCHKTCSKASSYYLRNKNKCNFNHILYIGDPNIKPFGDPLRIINMSQEKSKLNLYIYFFLNAVDLKREKKSFWK